MAIKLDDRGPVFFRQVRVGRDGKHFSVLKFRTMVVDAEASWPSSQAGNERSGPLFKMENDPRVTQVGRVPPGYQPRRAPAAFNVLRGRDEPGRSPPGAARRGGRVRRRAARPRSRVTPGITGLWQVEARDNPSFDAYRRLDLFYVENWSVTLDLMIIIGTLEQLVVKLFRTVTGAEPERRPTLTLAMR